jgi:hypothetical protein
MKLLKIAGLCLVAMFAMSMALSAAASAAGPVWEQCREGEKAGVTKWENARCSIASSAGKFEYKELTTTENASLAGTLTLKDTKTPVGIVEVACSTSGEGTIGPGKFGTITEVSFKSCKPGEHCEEVGKVEARDLPWQTEFIESEGVVRTAIKEDGKGAPGLSIECKVLGVKGADTCTTNNGRLSNGFGFAILWWLLTWLPSSAKSSCTVGGAESGETLGPIVLIAAGGWPIRD